jgi:thioredoxin reductase (NADPH)
VIHTETVESIDFSKRPFKIKSESIECEAETIIIATGANAKRLDVPGTLDGELWQRGVSACAVCDGALPFFRNRPLAVIGGGDSAVEEASYLTKFGSKVYIVHRRDELRASKIMQDRAANNPKIEMLWSSAVTKAEGGEGLEVITVEDLKTGATRQLPCAGLFFAVGHRPNTGFLDGALELDDQGYVVTTPGTTLTSVPGVFAAGDVQDKRYRQAITAAGSGCMAALDAEHFLSSHE